MNRRTWSGIAKAALVVLALIIVAPTTIGVDLNSVQTLSNKTLDRTNIIQTYANIQFPGAMCSNVTALTYWELPTSAAAVPACNTGSNTQKATLDFSSGGASSAQTWVQVPQGFNISNITSGEVLWYSASSSGSVVWRLSTACTPNNGTTADNPTFNTANTVTSAATSGSAVNSASFSALTMTGCATGYILHLKMERTPGSGGDSMTSNAAKMVMFRLRIPREG